MSNLQIYKKPELQVLSEQKKIRQMPIEEKKIRTTDIVVKLLATLGVSGNSDPSHWEVTIDFISDNYGDYSPEEILKAFQLAVKGDLYHKVGNEMIPVEVFQQLNSVVVGKVMRAYETYKANSLLEYRRKLAEQRAKNEQKVWTDEEKRAINNSAVLNQLNHFIEFGSIDVSRIYVYDILDEMNMMPKDEDVKKKLYKDVVEIMKSEYKSELNKAKKKLDRGGVKRIESDLESLGFAQCNEVVKRCKEMVLTQFFTRLSFSQDRVDEFRLKFAQ